MYILVVFKIRAGCFDARLGRDYQEKYQGDFRLQERLLCSNVHVRILDNTLDRLWMFASS